MQDAGVQHAGRALAYQDDGNALPETPVQPGEHLQRIELDIDAVHLHLHSLTGPEWALCRLHRNLEHDLHLSMPVSTGGATGESRAE